MGQLSVGSGALPLYTHMSAPVTCSHAFMTARYSSSDGEWRCYLLEEVLLAHDEEFLEGVAAIEILRATAPMSSRAPSALGQAPSL